MGFLELTFAGCEADFYFYVLSGIGHLYIQSLIMHIRIKQMINKNDQNTILDFSTNVKNGVKGVNHQKGQSEMTLV